MSGSSSAAEAPVVYRSPGPDEVVRTATVTVSADVYVGVGPGKVQLELAGAKERVIQEREPGPGCQRLTFTVPLHNNGQYQAAVTTEQPVPAAPPPDTACAGGTTATRDFFVAAPPDRPAGVKAAAENGQVKLSWEPNPEPDLLGYRVQRAKGSSAAFEPAGEAPGHSFTDLATGQGGEFRYQVAAVRQGARSQETVSSEPSVPVTVKTGTLTLGQDGGLASPPPLKLPEAAAAGGPTASDTGFEANLPYREVPEDGVEGLGARGARAAGLRSLGSFAGGLLALVTFFLLRCLRSEAARQPLPG